MIESISIGVIIISILIMLVIVVGDILFKLIEITVFLGEILRYTKLGIEEEEGET